MKPEEIRRKLALLDYRLAKILDERLELLLQANRLGEQESQNAPENANRFSAGLLNPAFIRNILDSLQTEAHKLGERHPTLIAFQGEHGAYSEMAARHWMPDAIPLPCTEFAEIFEAVENGLFDLGIVPVENNTGGVLNQVNQLILQSSLHVVGAVEMHIHHCLLAPRDADYRELHTVYSHTQALEQCRQFIARNKLHPIPYYDTAGAARMLAEERPPSAAAIASRLAADLYDLQIIKENIEDFPHNITRFMVFAREPREEKGTKCSVVFSTAHKAGTLFQALEVFARHNINLTRIESLPNLRGEFAFFLDFEGDQHEPHVQKALEEARQITRDFRLLGCYNEINVE